MYEQDHNDAFNDLLSETNNDMPYTYVDTATRGPEKRRSYLSIVIAVFLAVVMAVGCYKFFEERIGGERKVVFQLPADTGGSGTLNEGYMTTSSAAGFTYPAVPETERILPSVSTGTATALPPESDISGTAEIPDVLKALAERRFYIETVDPDGERSYVAMDGDDFEIYMEELPVSLPVMHKDGRFCIKNTQTKMYMPVETELDGILAEAVNDYAKAFAPEDIDYGSPDSVFNTVVNGENAACYQYQTDNGAISFFFTDGRLIQIDDCSYVLSIDAFHTNIPEDKISLAGYTEADSLASLLEGL